MSSPSLGPPDSVVLKQEPSLAAAAQQPMPSVNKGLEGSSNTLRNLTTTDPTVHYSYVCMPDEGLLL